VDQKSYERRKRDHLQLALRPENEARGLTGLDSIVLEHEALPDLDFEEISLSSTILGNPSKTPFFIAAVTAGFAGASEINMTFARACQKTGWALGIGSQRSELEAGPDASAWKLIREAAPDVLLMANIGASQLATADIEKIHDLLAVMRAKALVIHANPLQECLQPEGTAQFKGTTGRISALCRELGLPVVLKETGCGFSTATLKRLSGAGLAAIDISGLGGTHWGRIESARAGSIKDHIKSSAGTTFATWGIPTVESLQNAVHALPGTELWASGGVRSGLDAAKLIAMGASQTGFARPALEAAMAGAEKLVEWMKTREYELKTALFCTGCRNPDVLGKKENVWKTKCN